MLSVDLNAVKTNRLKNRKIGWDALGYACLQLNWCMTDFVGGFVDLLYVGYL